MNAIQRWYFWYGDECPVIANQPIRYAPDDLWCKEKDVAELERVIYEYVGTIQNLRAEVSHRSNVAAGLQLSNELLQQDRIELMAQLKAALEDDRGVL